MTAEEQTGFKLAVFLSLKNNSVELEILFLFKRFCLYLRYKTGTGNVLWLCWIAGGRVGGLLREE